MECSKKLGDAFAVDAKFEFLRRCNEEPENKYKLLIREKKFHVKQQIAAFVTLLARVSLVFVSFDCNFEVLLRILKTFGM